MRRALGVLAAAVCFAGCESATSGFSAHGIEHLKTSSDQAVVELFLAERGPVECETCAIVEVVVGTERWAYFVRPEPACGFRASHSRGTESGYFKEGTYGLLVNLTQDGVLEVERCLAGMPAGERSREFLVVVGRRAVGTTYVAPYNLRTRDLFFSGTELLEGVHRVLSVEAQPVS